MDTGTKILVGVAVVGGAFLVYKVVNHQTAVQAAAKSTASPDANTTNSLLNFGTSLFNYFSKQSPQKPVTNGSSGSWDSTKDNYLPLLPGQTAYQNDTTHDDILS